MNFYINIVDDKIKQKDDNDTIGLLICKTKDKEIAEYALKGQTNPLAVGEYVFENLSEDLQRNLPDVEKIRDFLKDF
ncbi:PDDEXK nuclease domain-containing protein [Candidatus Absconditicoccus praedator]|uniref:PDDEXK nuclease domain-containing protein n=1 Tax=Candidatus Absconditicoccus praedator TaxID=2735562 RepID=UPI001E405C9A|nr:PDDEXK nuclease domain-containing protein [Candidatus Absconditicoccus praedator]UFX82758.1 DUF1016 family protein [Candidatus Absconditicoccus praedator]